ncbi:hypothetical protein CJF42_16455 [Pseudoalteromonas sp. NBT06-2]|uniref:DUF2987 domain-containing protein n=1 Tax=Pseudoalteromonas sp. NBT06-2 TaxID=2025950 RepID=UPI000BA5777B|nr:DUF2987 domain-containing protein [Pseudoalteromonas sp. NBT06-2]PAJ73311.1 hypothetical protein CJF42_16455 [Pseudoalteromonas sp. NBT06-2]
MSNRFFTFGLSVAIVSASFITTAKEFVASYDGFYDRMKIVNKGEYNQAKVGFYLKEMSSGENCSLSEGHIITEKQEFPLNFSEQMELLLPFDEKLDKDKAMVVAYTKNPKHECQLVMQIEAFIDKKEFIAKSELFDTFTELNDLIDDLSGFVLRTVFGFLIPDMVGVTLLFDQPVSLLSKSDNSIKCVGTRCTIVINSDWDSSTEILSFSVAPSKVIPYIKK